MIVIYAPDTGLLPLVGIIQVFAFLAFPQQQHCPLKYGRQQHQILNGAALRPYRELVHHYIGQSLCKWNHSFQELLSKHATTA
jgi:hypothetical protein